MSTRYTGGWYGPTVRIYQVLINDRIIRVGISSGYAGHHRHYGNGDTKVIRPLEIISQLCRVDWHYLFQLNPDGLWLGFIEAARCLPSTSDYHTAYISNAQALTNHSIRYSFMYQATICLSIMILHSGLPDIRLEMKRNHRGQDRVSFVLQQTQGKCIPLTKDSSPIY